MDPKQRRQVMFDALRRLLVRAAEVRPQILIYEDAHWMDKATEEMLAATADIFPSNRIVQILTYRTGYAHPLGDRSFHTRINLDVLSGDDSVEIARAILDAESLPGDLKALIARKAEGNPFFVEEVVRSLRDLKAIRSSGDGYVLTRRLDEIVVPDTIQDVIMARICSGDRPPTTVDANCAAGTPSTACSGTAPPSARPRTVGTRRRSFPKLLPGEVDEDGLERWLVDGHVLDREPAGLGGKFFLGRATL